MTILHDQVVCVHTRQDLIRFIRALGADIACHPSDWENQDIQSYLDAMAAWIEGMDGYFANSGQEMPRRPSWRLIGEILLAASIYE